MSEFAGDMKQDHYQRHPPVSKASVADNRITPSLFLNAALTANVTHIKVNILSCLSTPDTLQISHN